MSATPAVPRRPLRRVITGVVILFGVIDVVATSRLVLAPHRVGHFRSAEGRGAYVAAYGQAMTALPAPTVVHDVVTEWGTVRVYEWAAPGTEDTVPVVLLPGRSSGVPMWQGNLPAVAQDRRVLAFDALGDAGLSVQGVPLASFDDVGAWIHAVLARLAPEGAHVVGHSWGGASAVSLAHQYPDDVVSLTLLEPILTFAYPEARMFGWTILASLPGLPTPIREYALGKVGGAEFDPDDPMAAMIAAGAEHFAAALPTPGPVSDERAGRLTMPVYVAIASDDSLAGGERAAARAAEILPAGTVETWPDTTHSLPMQVAGPLGERLDPFWAAAEE